ncbi:MAG TPA: site-specific DNA-methyltransferase [Candidatus Atribacteria bacterium]|nr:site-specific DNA-methyltransferase [Candidatus Atribacteria bacterium]
MIQLFHGDCLKVIDDLIKENVQVDAIITDPPYGIIASKWDKVVNFKKLIPKLYQLLSPIGSVILFSSGAFTPRIMLADLEHYKYKYVWVKNTKGLFVHAKNRPMTQHEDILVFSQAPMGHKNLLKNKRMFYTPRHLTEVNKIQKAGKNQFGNVLGIRPSQKAYFKKTHTGYPTDVLFYNKDNTNYHPTQKPVALLEFLVETYTDEGGTVLDFTMGSGSTGVACKNLNRNFIGIELDEEYYKIAKDRIDNA